MATETLLGIAIGIGLSTACGFRVFVRTCRFLQICRYLVNIITLLKAIVRKRNRNTRSFRLLLLEILHGGEIFKNEEYSKKSVLNFSASEGSKPCFLYCVKYKTGIDGCYLLSINVSPLTPTLSLKGEEYERGLPYQ